MKRGFRSLLALACLLISALPGGAQVTPLDPVTIAEGQPVEGVDQLRIFQRDPLAAPREAPPFAAFELEVRQHILPKAARERRLLRDLADCSTGQLHAQLLEQWRAARRFIYLYDEHDLVSALFARADLKAAAAETLGLADWADGHPYIGGDPLDIEDDGRVLWVRLAAVDWASAKEIALSLRGQRTMSLSLGAMNDADWALLPPERIPDFFDLLTEMDDNTLFAETRRIPPDMYYWAQALLPDNAKKAISRLAATSGSQAATDVARKITHVGARRAALEIAGMTDTGHHAEFPPRINSLETLRMFLAASATRRLYPHWRLEILQATERLDAATAATWVQSLTPLEAVSEGGERLFSRWAELDGPAALAHLVSLTRQKGPNLDSLTCEVFAAASGDDLRLRVLRDLPETLSPYALQGFMATASLARVEEWLALQNKWYSYYIDPLLTRIALTDPARALSLQRRLFPDASSPEQLGRSGLIAAWLLHDFDSAAAFLKNNGEARCYLDQYVQLLPLGRIVSLQDQLNPAIFDWHSLDGTWKWLMFENPDTILPALQGRTSDPRFRGFLLYLAAHAATFHPLDAVKFALNLKPEPSLEEMQPILDRAAGRSEAISNYNHERAFLPTSAPQPRSSR